MMMMNPKIGCIVIETDTKRSAKRGKCANCIIAEATGTAAAASAVDHDMAMIMGLAIYCWWWWFVATNRRRVTAAGETLLSPAVICAAVAVARDSSSGWQISNADSIREWLMYGVQVLLAGNHMYGIGNTTKRFVIVGG